MSVFRKTKNDAQIKNDKQFSATKASEGCFSHGEALKVTLYLYYEVSIIMSN
ncbi:MAG: hypothetical protein LBB34_03030 [Holosporales bacterium]|nr:hypothetical protein [Holosporales bacterium]